LNCVDSSAWLEYFAGGGNAPSFRSAIEDAANLVVPSLCLLEVTKRLLRQRGEQAALRAVAFMAQGHVQDLDAELAVLAARLGIDHDLALADSVVLATARACGAILWTQDADFAELPDVRYFPRQHPV